MTSNDHDPFLSRSRFLRMAYLVQGGVLLLAIVIACFLALPARSLLRWDPLALLAGLAAVGPMLAIYRFSPNLRRLASESLGDSLARCTWWDLVVLSALAGIGEELMFRGVIYAGLARMSSLLALIVSNVGFGALHALSWNYFLVATLIGLGMHFLAESTGDRNLLAPMVAHGVYDLVAFRLLIDERRAGNTCPPTSTPTSD